MLYYWTSFAFVFSQLFVGQGHCQPIDHQSQPESNDIATRSLQNNTAIYWYTEVTIGTQNFNLTVDTGSSDLWVYAPISDDGKSAAPHNSYTCDPTTSASKCIKEGNFSIGYGATDDFGASGYFVADKVTIANKAVPTMSVGVATIVGWPASWSEDGILGLSWNIHNMDSPQQATFPQCLLNDHSIAPVFAMDFPSIGKDGGKVDIDFGYVNETKAAAGLVTALVDKTNPTWTAKDARFIIGNDINPVTTDGKTVLNQDLIFDTGAGPLMIVDPLVSKAYYNRVHGAVPITNQEGSWKFPCDAVLPNLFLGFTDGVVGMSARQMSYNDPDDENMCTGPLDSRGVAEGEGGRIGTIFFQSHYVVFDMTPEQPKIQFAPWNGTSDGLPHFS